MPAPLHDCDEELLRKNLLAVQSKIEEACRRVGRSPQSVRVVAVTKSATLETIARLIAIGVRDFGENRPQQLLERAEGLGVEAGWHLIGPLQRNKVRAVLPAVRLIHSVDSLRILNRIGDVADELTLTPHVLLQANISGESAKGGFSPDELRSAWDGILAERRVIVDGLMTMAPFTEATAEIRSAFRGLRELRDELQRRSPEHALSELSMGMSNDFEIAVEEGATLLRLGTVLFEE